MASSGIAALLLQGGRTVHSRLKVPIRLNEISMCGISKQTVLAKLIQRAKLLVWDEAPMTHKFAAECTGCIISVVGYINHLRESEYYLN